jgi:hypothetical protein
MMSIALFPYVVVACVAGALLAVAAAHSLARGRTQRSAA